jgi:hypothetical protein
MRTISKDYVESKNGGSILHLVIFLWETFSCNKPIIYILNQSSISVYKEISNNEGDKSLWISVFCIYTVKIEKITLKTVLKWCQN